MKPSPGLASSVVATLPARRPSRAEAEDAVRVLLAWAGDNPDRAGLENTPQRVVDAYLQYFAGYRADAMAELTATFEDPLGYDDMVLVKDIHFESHCEHHIAPFFGVAHVAYMPGARIVGLSKLARVVDIFARRLQTQETLTGEIATTIAKGLGAKGVAVLLSARHHCMAARSANQTHAMTQTSRFIGTFESDAALRARFIAAVHGPA
jgi:GTP cyclohydrolase IA